MAKSDWINWHKVQRILCIGAHADDIEIGCGGTILRILHENPLCEVHWIVLSAAKERRVEAAASADAFLAGAVRKEIRQYEFSDRFFPAEVREIKQAFFETREEFCPDLVFTHRIEDRHQDHRCVAECTWNTFREQLILEYEIPKYEGDLGQPNFFVELNREICQRKISLLMEHFPSQRGKYWFDEETYWALLRLRGLEARATSRYAEAFTARKVIVAS
ncbi:MAG: PIG-L family deacetylase [Planctomycetota bacterium]|nr:PIG-L family deacetylase [Planctomycetota bacterium]MDA1179325.1 PIG-L family deacetylase [Planctomycetota bacterium]